MRATTNATDKVTMSESGMIDKLMNGAGRMMRGLMLAVAAVLVLGSALDAQAATRFYLQNTAAAVTPVTQGAWSASGNAQAIQMASTKSGSIASNGVAEINASNTWDVMVLKVVSEPIPAQTISGTVDWVIGAGQNNNLMNAYWAAHIYVVSNDGTQIRGTLLANNAENTTNEWGNDTTTAQGWGTQGAKNLASVTAQTDDRIVVEIGYIARNTSTTSRTGTLWYGGIGNDLAVNGDQTAAVGWVDFSGVNLCTSTTGNVSVAGGSANGPSVSVCSMYNLGGNTLSNITIQNGATVYYNGSTCSNIPTIAAGGAPVDWTDAALTLTVSGTDNCSATKQGSGTLNFSTCTSSSGPLEILDGSILTGNPSNLTLAINANGATVTNVKVVDIAGAGSDVNENESFNAGGVEGWDPGKWMTNNATTPPGNGDLMTGFYTPSDGTGPDSVHDGDFLYYEASQTVSGTHPDRTLTHDGGFDTANIELHVSFVYNMNGADIGTLQMQARNAGYNGGAWTTEWTKSGNQGDVWSKVTVDLYDGLGASGTSYATGSTEIRFVFKYGSGPFGDIAIDDVHIIGPRHAGATLFEGTYAAALAASTTGWSEGSKRMELTGADNCGLPMTGYGYVNFVQDSTLPVVTSFNLPLVSLSPIPVYSFTASDNIAVAGYLITTSSIKPAANDPGWSGSKPLKVVTAVTGPVTYYAWAKDMAGNVSDFVDGFTNQTVDIQPDVTAPVIAQFTLPSAGFSPVTVNNFTVSDDSGTVAGYMITTSTTPPLPGDAGWLAAPPTKITTAATGSTIFYAWAKDSAGNVSAGALATVNVLVDTNPPVVSFQLPVTYDALEVPVTLFTATDTTGGAVNNTGVAAYMITQSATPPAAGAAGWQGTPPTTVTVAGEGASTFHAWAKDNSGNVSVGVSQTVTVTLPAQCVFAMDPNGTLVQTENWAAMGAPNPWAWDTILTPLADSSVQSALNNGGGDLSSGGYIITAAGGTGNTPQGSRADYPVFFPNGTQGNWCIWIRGLDQSGTGGGDSNFWGIDGAYVGAMTEAADNQWAWTNGLQNGARCANVTVNGQDEYPPSSGTFGQWHTINLWPRETGQKNDMLYLTKNTTATAGGAFTGNNDQSTVLPLTSYTEIDPTCVDTTGGGPPGGGGGSGYINIPDGQSVTGSPIATTLLFETDLGLPLQYRALGAPTDGFEHQSIDPKWGHTNIGNEPLLVDTVPVVEGQGILKLAGSGADIWNTSDFFAYHYQPGISGNFTIDVNMKSLVDKQTNTTANQNISAKAGIMVRQSLANNSRNVMMLVTSANGSHLQYRASDGGTTAYVNGTNNGVTAGNNTWLRLRRTGNLFEGFHSTDNGQNWTSVGTVTVNMAGAVNIGLGVTSHNTARDSIGYFDNFLFMPAGQSGMSESWVSTATGLDTTQPVAWVAGSYGLAVRHTGSGVYAANTFDYDPCSDSTPSSLSIHSGAAVGGSAVSLANLFDHTGNVGGFTYQINGNSVNNPWNSFSLVPSGSSQSVTLTVNGTDPDCGGSFYSDSASILVNNTCADPTPSTITILTGQVVGGPSVDLTKLYTATGNVTAGGLTFKINGTVIGDPTKWDSRQYGATAADAVSFEVSGIDPDCGNGITAVNNLLVDNTCVRNFPSISFDKDIGYAGQGRAIPYKVTIRNEDSFNCGPSTFSVAVLSDSNATDFEPSTFNPAGSNLGLTLQGRQKIVIELAVKAKSGVSEWNSNETTLQITSSNPVHNAPKTTGSVVTQIFLVSPITHNSVTTGSTKWNGNWGTSEPGSKYGNFDCLTCHSKTGPNIKWMKGTISTPDGSTWGVSGQASLSVEFKDARNIKEIVAEGGHPINDVYWGHDDPNGDGSGRASSNRVCETCHSATQHHRYNTNADPDGPGPLGPQVIVQNQTHFPGRDCTDCHRHSLGFTADCTGCHGDPPLEATLGGPNGLADIPGPTGSVTPGTHYKHTVVLGFSCDYCHAGWRSVGEMPRTLDGTTSAKTGLPYQQINHKFNVFFDRGITDPMANNGHYTGQDGVNYEIHADQVAAGNQLADGTIPPGKGTMTCENIYCHGGTESMGGSNPQWNGNIACNSCHGTSTTNTPPGYSHTTHVGKMGLACTACHFTNGQNAGYNGHVNGRVNVELNVAGKGGTPKYNPGGGDPSDAVVRFDSNADGSDMPPSAQYGSCLNIACHYGRETPIWNNPPDRNGDSLPDPATCTTCHNDGNDSGNLVEAPPATGNHELHVHPPAGTMAEKMISSFVSGCESCHGGGANSGAHSGHIDGKVSIGGGMTYSQPSGPGGTCTSVCHGLQGVDINTQGTASPCDDIVSAVAITWGSSHTLDCSACHKSPYIGPTVVDPDNEGSGMAASGYGSHLKTTKGETFSASTNWTVQCRQCHPYHQKENLVKEVEIPLPPQTWDNPGTTATEADDMRYKLGLQYTVTGGLHIGGCATDNNAWYYNPAAPTEAEMCWGCHGLDSELNEWGFNADTNGTSWPETGLAPDTITPAGHGYWDDSGKLNATGGSYNYGYLYTADHAAGTYAAGNATAKWVTASGRGHYRRDGYQHQAASVPGYVMSRRISSVHSVNFSVGADPGSSVAMNIHTDGLVKRDESGTYQQKLEAAADIRCSYCHDVHDLNRAVANAGSGTQETATGRPYLRGSWLGNPYAADAPPLSTYEAGYTANATNRLSSGGRIMSVATPRLFSGSSGSKLKGGYFIDANSNRPTAAHINNGNRKSELTDTAGLCVLCHGDDVDNMDFYPNATTTMWRTGQVNGHANASLGGTGVSAANARNIFDATRGQANEVMGNQSGVAQGNQWGKGRLDSSPQSTPMDKAFDTANPTLGVSGWYGGTWNSDPAAKPAQYATWYSATGIGHDDSGSNRAHSFSCSKCHSPHATGLPALLVTNCLDRATSSYANGGTDPTQSQATNCHRKDNTTTGWHKLATGQ